MVRYLSEQLPQQYYFHNLQHTLEVVSCVEKIVRAEKVAAADSGVLRTAALFHDAGYMFRYADNEALGAEFAVRELPRFGYSVDQIEQIRELILSTVFPQKPQTYFQRIICDADLFYLALPGAVARIADFRRELAALGMVHPDSVWWQMEWDFLHRQHFFLPFCETAYQQALPALLQQLQATLKIEE